VRSFLFFFRRLLAVTLACMCVRAFHRPPLSRQAALAGFMKLNWTGSECWPVATRPVYAF